MDNSPSRARRSSPVRPEPTRYWPPGALGWWTSTASSPGGKKRGIGLTPEANELRSEEYYKEITAELFGVLANAVSSGETHPMLDDKAGELVRLGVEAGRSSFPSLAGAGSDTRDSHPTSCAAFRSSMRPPSARSWTLAENSTAPWCGSAAR